MATKLQLLHVALRNLIEAEQSSHGYGADGYKKALSKCEEMQQLLAEGIIDERYNNLLYSITRMITEAPPRQGNGYDFEVFDLVADISQTINQR